MKIFIVLVSIFMLAGCASTPKIRVKNCKAVGADLYDCELIQHNERQR